MKYIKILLTAVVVFVFSGCSIKDIQKPIAKYTLSNSTYIKRSDFASKKVLKIDRFKSLKLLQSDEIWYQKPSYEMNSYVYSRWNGNFDTLIEKNIADAIYKSHIFKSVFEGHSKIKPDVVLEGDIQQAVQKINDKAKVVFKIRLYLVDRKDSRLIDAKEFEYTKKCKSIDVKGAVNAYNQIIKNLDKDVVLWIKQSMKKN
jgi:ABC-type uncharacterized transport system auxiliary subunit